MSFELYPHQRTAVEKMHNGCILNGDVGSGKTLTALAYYIEKVCGGSIHRDTPMSTPMDLLILTTARKRDDLDWHSEALHFGIFPDRENSYNNVQITVDSFNNIKKYVDVKNVFLIIDEYKVGGSGVWSKTFLKIAKNNPWIILSATPADVWLDYVPAFLGNGFYKNRSDFIDSHVIWTYHGRYRKIRGYFGRRQLEAYRDAILIEMPFKRHTTRHLVTVPVEYDKEIFNKVWKKLWNVYDDVPLIDVSEKHRLGRRVVNTDQSRLRAIEKLGDEHPRMIVYYTFDHELDLLRTLMTSMDIPVAEFNGHLHEPVPKTERWVYLVQYQAGAEAWNCTTTDTIVYYSLTYSHRWFEQSQGRIDRLDTPFEDLYYYVLISEAEIDQLIWRALQGKKSFHESRNVKFNKAA